MATRRTPAWEPRSEDYFRVFAQQNPWHAQGQVPDELAFSVERPLVRHLGRRILDDRPRRFQLVLGPRRVGKTTVMYQTVRRLIREGVPPRRLWWLRLDHPLLMPIPLGSLVRFALDQAPPAPKGEPLYVFLDELTYARDWDLWLKTLYDERWPVRVVATSSATAALRHRRTESGVGRWEEQYLSPYLLTEFLELVGVVTTVEARATLDETIAGAVRDGVATVGVEALRRRFLLTGGFPELLVPERGWAGEGSDGMRLQRAQAVLRSDVVERAIYKDIPQAYAVDNPLLLERLLYVLAGQLTGILAPRSLCASLDGMSQPTFDKYLRYLELAFLVFTLPNFSENERRVQKRGRKLYFVDGAVRNAALLRGLAPEDDPGEMGRLTENLAAAHLHALGQQASLRIFHWREQGDEVDLVLNHPERPMAFEIGRADHSRRGLRAFLARHPKFGGQCYVVSHAATPIAPERASDGIGTLPLDLFLLAVGRQADAEMARRLSG